jgi:hypothetical protein
MFCSESGKLNIPGFVIRLCCRGENDSYLHEQKGMKQSTDQSTLAFGTSYTFIIITYFCQAFFDVMGSKAQNQRKMPVLC